MFGKEALGLDQFFRSLQFESVVEKEFAALDTAIRKLLEAYAAGVNNYVATATSLPIEFNLMGVSFAQWTVKDSLMIMKTLAFLDSSTHWQLTALRFSLRSLLGRNLAERLVPLNGLHSILPQYSVISTMEDVDLKFFNKKLASPASRTASEERRSSDRRGKTGESNKTVAARKHGGVRGANAWAVRGKSTESGSAMLVFDFFTDHRVPAEYYLVCVKYPGKGQKVMGATVAGVPVVLFGRNENVSWGMTDSAIENMDLYSVKFSPDGKRYRYGQGWKELEVHEEIIKVKGSNDYIMKVYRTRHGPVLNITAGSSVDTILK